MKSIAWITVAFFSLLRGTGHAQDWPTYQQNNYRNAVAPVSLAAETATSWKLAWRWTSPDTPRPAWYGPAKWDAYAGLRDLKSMRNYDVVYHAVAGRQLVFFGNSTNDSLYCLYADTGQTKWVFTADAPVRVPPTLAADAVYIGADDGFVYCIDAEEGSVRWKFSPSSSGRRILHDGRLISLWPCRSGVTVDGGTAYFTASLLPWNHGYLCAIDAVSGKVESEQHFVKQLDNATMEAPIALSREHIIVPQGRIAPMLFDRTNGERQGSLQGGGGSFVVLARDQVYHGPGNKDGWITSSRLDTRDVIATFKSANAMVIDGRRSFMLTDKEIVCSDLEVKRIVWRGETDCTHELIKVGEALVLGGDRKVAAIDSRNGDFLWQHGLDGVAHGLAFAEGKLLVSTDGGTIYAFGPSDTPQTRRPVPDKPTATSPDSRGDNVASARGSVELDTAGVAVGPWLQFESPSSANVMWETDTPQPSRLEVKIAGETHAPGQATLSRTHRVRLTDLPHHAIFHYRVASQNDAPWLEVDTLFNYTQHGSNEPLGPTAPPATGNAVSINGLLDNIQARNGICVLMGVVDGRTAYDIIQRTNLRVIAFGNDGKRLESIRRAFVDAGLYGSRFACHHVERLEKLPTVGNFANLVTSELTEFGSQGPAVVQEAVRIAQPRGYVAFASSEPQLGAALVAASSDSPSEFVLGGVAWSVISAPQIAGAGEWTHIYGHANNSLYGGEQLQMASHSDEFEVQWLGRPGPRFQPDRNGRKPPPVAAGGKLFLQGLTRVAALDQYNGSILWSLEIPDLARFNIPRDCGNWCADSTAVYLAIRNHCWIIDADTGAVERHIPSAGPGESVHEWDWGYVARAGELLLGSSVRRGTSATSYWGKGGWYDGEADEATHKVCSDALFAVVPATGRRVWTYRSGAVINSTITATAERLFFVECRAPGITSRTERRIGDDALWSDLYLVGLDLKTGNTVVDQALSVVGGKVVFYLAAGEGRLVLVSSADKKYHVYGFTTEDGRPVWACTFSWGKGKADHGSHLSRPAIVGEKLFVRPAVLDLATGKRLPLEIPVAGCGTYAATDGALFFRAGSGKNSAVWDTRSGDFTTWSRLRPDCWLSTIPAGGMLLSPEGGGGCSCGSWLETSLGFMPVSVQRRDSPLDVEP